MTTVSLTRILALTLALMLPTIAPAAGKDEPKFEDYPANPIYTGHPARVSMATADARLFRTKLRHAAKLPADFAGEYVMARWGCGCSCSHGAVLSLKTGKSVFLPTVCCWNEEGHHLEYRLDSRLIVASGLLNETGEYGRHYFEFKAGRLVHIMTKPVRKMVY